MRYNELFESVGHEGGGAKKFEDDLVTLALLSSKEDNSSKDLSTIYKENASDFDAPKKQKQTIGAIEKLKEKFPSEIWTEGYNSNFVLDRAEDPTYGVKSAKSDIILNGKPISVKLDTDFVVASAQNKDEFAGIFGSALDYYTQHNDVDFNVSDAIDNLRKEVETAKKEFIGEVKLRILPLARKKGVLQKFEDVSDFHDELEKFMDEHEKQAIDHYGNATKILKESVLKNIQSSLSDNQELKKYIVWEALSSSLKYNFKEPYAQWVLSPSGVHGIANPNDKYVIACTNVSKFDIRALPTGRMRSGTTAMSNYYKKKLAAGNAINVAELYDDIRQMAFGMKIDVQKNALVGLDLEESALNEAFSPIEFGKRIFAIAMDWIKKISVFFNNMLSKISQLKNGSLQDWINAFGIEAQGIIKLP